MKKAILMFALPYVAMALGIAFNQAAVHFNGGHMPVLFPGHACMLEPLIGDPVHNCWDAHTHVKFFTDWLIDSTRVESIGDQLLQFSRDVKTPSLVMAVGMLAHDVFKKKVSIER